MLEDLQSRFEPAHGQERFGEHFAFLPHLKRELLERVLLHLEVVEIAQVVLQLLQRQDQFLHGFGRVEAAEEFEQVAKLLARDAQPVQLLGWRLGVVEDGMAFVEDLFIGFPDPLGRHLEHRAGGQRCMWDLGHGGFQVALPVLDQRVVSRRIQRLDQAGVLLFLVEAQKMAQRDQVFLHRGG